MHNKKLKRLLAFLGWSLAEDLIFGIILGLLGVALIAIGLAWWHPLAIVGALLVAISLFLIGIV